MQKISSQIITEELSKIVDNLNKDLDKISSLDRIKQIRNVYLGKESEISKILTKIPQIPKDQRREIGIFINTKKKDIEDKFNSLTGSIIGRENSQELISYLDKLDSTSDISEVMELLA